LQVGDTGPVESARRSNSRVLGSPFSGLSGQPLSIFVTWCSFLDGFPYRSALYFFFSTVLHVLLYWNLQLWLPVVKINPRQSLSFFLQWIFALVFPGPWRPQERSLTNSQGEEDQREDKRLDIWTRRELWKSKKNKVCLYKLLDTVAYGYVNVYLQQLLWQCEKYNRVPELLLGQPVRFIFYRFHLLCLNQSSATAGWSSVRNNSLVFLLLSGEDVQLFRTHCCRYYSEGWALLCPPTLAMYTYWGTCSLKGPFNQVRVVLKLQYHWYRHWRTHVWHTLSFSLNSWNK
jgi:hypothetical protein